MNKNKSTITTIFLVGFAFFIGRMTAPNNASAERWPDGQNPAGVFTAAEEARIIQLIEQHAPTSTPVPVTPPSEPCNPAPLPADESDDDTEPREPAPASSDGRININTATAAQLDELPRIGEAMARRIIDGRPYSKVEDLLEVRGIGEKTLDGLRPLITVD